MKNENSIKIGGDDPVIFNRRLLETRLNQPVPSSNRLKQIAYQNELAALESVYKCYKELIDERYKDIEEVWDHDELDKVRARVRASKRAKYTPKIVELEKVSLKKPEPLIIKQVITPQTSWTGAFVRFVLWIVLILVLILNQDEIQNHYQLYFHDHVEIAKNETTKIWTEVIKQMDLKQ